MRDWSVFDVPLALLVKSTYVGLGLATTIEVGSANV
jgi:hypothetical protein